MKEALGGESYLADRGLCVAVYPRELHDALKRRCLYRWIDTVPWAQALLALDSGELEETLDVVLKVREDLDQVRDRGVLQGV